ncbi:MAG: RluA family pseudouridine synthase [Thermosipho sp. (in: Bacteria)]|nr:RluA family pseudouridine synthase [Thermosipho sp. (in: thermotogales)]
MKVNEKNYYSRLDKFIRKNFQNLPLNAIYKLIRTGKVFINGKKVKNPSYKIDIGDEITIKENLENYNRELNNSIKPIKMNLEIIYEDEDILVLNKKAGIPLHPGKGVHVATLIEGLLYYGQQNNFEPRLVHRLDKHTSGILIVAKNVNAARELGKIISTREISKEYITLVVGKIDKTGKIDSSLDGKNSLTIFKVKNYFKTKLGYFSLVEVNLKTGRKHQIRRHFSNIGHPVVGDDIYGNKKLNREFKRLYGLKRYFLHCKKMGFIYKNKKIVVEAPLAKDLELTLNKLKEGD